MNEPKVLLSREKIAERVAQMAAQITQDAMGQPVIFVGVLKGAAIFLSDLVRQVQVDATFEFIAVSTYGNRPTPTQELRHAWDSTGEVKLTKDVDQSLRGKNVILVEDILDTGLNADVFETAAARASAEKFSGGGIAGQTVAAQAASACGLHRLRNP